MTEQGRVIADRYRIISKAGHGGMSDVYKAIDTKLDRNVAVKILKKEFSDDVNFVSKFRTEAQSAARLEHPNIVNIYDVGFEEGIYYIIMEYVEGITLKSYIEKKGRLSYKETLSIAIQVGRGIMAAHAKQIIHRDIKPQNIVISTDGKVKVTDFGIARAVSEDTIHADVMGSIHYTSPEQARSGYVSKASDIYSLGIVMYEMVTGRVPFDGESTVEVAIRHLQEEITAPSAYAPDLPKSLEKIIIKCTQKNPDLRYDSMENLLIDLRKALVNPDGDFVVLIPIDQDKTKVITEDELREIQNQKSSAEDSGEEDYEDDEDEDEEDEDDGVLNSKMDKAVRVIQIIILVIIIVIVIWLVGSVFGLFHFSPLGSRGASATPSAVSEEAPETYEMIDLSGMTVDEAKAALSDYDLSIETKSRETSQLYDAGEIISQDPEKGEVVEAGSTVYVVTSLGTEEENAEEITLVDVSGYEYNEAKKVLTEKGLIVSREFENSSSVDSGEVIYSDPSAGSTVKVGSTVTLYVSSGEESVTVPNVVGYTQSEAEEALTDAGLLVDSSSEYSDDVSEGCVIRQSISSGRSVEPGTTVSIVISLGGESVTYRLDSTISAPEDVDILYADITVTASESDEILGNWDGISPDSFPYNIELSGLDCSRATISISWYYENEAGETVNSLQTKTVNLVEE